MLKEPTNEENEIAKQVVDACFQIHKAFGPGLLENVYEVCLADEMRHRGFHVETQKPIPLFFNSRKIETAFRADMIINDSVLIELKSIEKIGKLQEAQTLTYMKLAGISLGLLINFNVSLIKDGIRRFYMSENIKNKSFAALAS